MWQFPFQYNNCCSHFHFLATIRAIVRQTSKIIIRMLDYHFHMLIWIDLRIISISVETLHSKIYIQWIDVFKNNIVMSIRVTVVVQPNIRLHRNQCIAWPVRRTKVTVNLDHQHRRLVWMSVHPRQNLAQAQRCRYLVNLHPIKRQTVLVLIVPLAVISNSHLMQLHAYLIV